MSDTQSRILDAALALFARQGFEETGMREIAAQVGIRAPSIYKHFKSKEAILVALLDACGPGPMTQALVHIEPGVTADQAVAQLMDILFGLFGNERDNQLMRIVLGESLRNPVVARLVKETIFGQEREALVALFQQWQQQHLVKPYDPGLLADECLSRGIMRRYQLLVCADDPDSLALVKEALGRQVQFFWDWIKVEAQP
ncbi:TetR/AcrR family transcriptional regulator [Exilibacterium tricleocarpae]|uniref:TetR/AcrR family transcriptional regulator n=1 Tax=Exilibacterium tricleocarpae TaxID=2591008 RepID=A0A545TVW9_9GAMM|nr:TetR/AcrR family transcriptional regulator [Exilibacterium tricleocarpae]TQV81301.1 TetR/AcrR family transcriptional regulator [Exilibacterium tricleocarpae]